MALTVPANSFTVPACVVVWPLLVKVHSAVCVSPALSVNVPVKLTDVPTAKRAPLGGPLIATAGAGFVTVTVKLHVAVWPAASVTVEFTVVVPITKDVPEAGVEATVKPGQLSLAFTVKLTTVEHWPGAVPATMFAGHEMAGFCVSLTVTVKLHVAVPPLFWAVHWTVVLPTGKTCGEEMVVAPTLH